MRFGEGTYVQFDKVCLGDAGMDLGILYRVNLARGGKSVGEKVCRVARLSVLVVS